MRVNSRQHSINTLCTFSFQWPFEIIYKKNSSIITMNPISNTGSQPEMQNCGCRLNTELRHPAPPQGRAKVPALLEMWTRHGITGSQALRKGRRGWAWLVKGTCRWKGRLVHRTRDALRTAMTDQGHKVKSGSANIPLLPSGENSELMFGAFLFFP